MLTNKRFLLNLRRRVRVKVINLGCHLQFVSFDVFKDVFDLVNPHSGK